MILDFSWRYIGEPARWSMAYGYIGTMEKKMETTMAC